MTLTLLLHSCKTNTTQPEKETSHAGNIADPILIEKQTSETISQETPGEISMKKSDCYSCHHNDTKLVGPSFKEIAEKYPISEEHVKILVNKIIHGGKGVWGELPMQAHSQLSDDEARGMVTYILALDTLH